MKAIRIMVLCILLALIYITEMSAEGYLIQEIEQSCVFSPSWATIKKYKGFSSEQAEFDFYVFSMDQEHYYAFICEDNLSSVSYVDSIPYSLEDRINCYIIEDRNVNNDLIGFFDKDTGFFSGLIFDSVIPLSNDVAAVYRNSIVEFVNIHNGETIYSFTEGDQLTDSAYYGGNYSCIPNEQSVLKIIDKEGNLISEIPDVYAPYSVTDNGLLVVVGDDGLYGIRTIRNDIIVDNKYLYISAFSNGKALMKDKNGLWGVISDDGRIVLPCSLDLINHTGAVYNNGFIMVKLKNNEWIIIDENGDTTVIIHE